LSSLIVLAIGQELYRTSLVPPVSAVINLVSSKKWSFMTMIWLYLFSANKHISVMLHSLFRHSVNVLSENELLKSWNVQAPNTTRDLRVLQIRCGWCEYMHNLVVGSVFSTSVVELPRKSQRRKIARQRSML